MYWPRHMTTRTHCLFATVLWVVLWKTKLTLSAPRITSACDDGGGFPYPAIVTADVTASSGGPNDPPPPRPLLVFLPSSLPPTSACVCSLHSGQGRYRLQPLWVRGHVVVHTGGQGQVNNSVGGGQGQRDVCAWSRDGSDLCRRGGEGGDGLTVTLSGRPSLQDGSAAILLLEVIADDDNVSVTCTKVDTAATTPPAPVTTVEASVGPVSSTDRPLSTPRVQSSSHADPSLTTPTRRAGRTTARKKTTTMTKKPVAKSTGRTGDGDTTQYDVSRLSSDVRKAVTAATVTEGTDDDDCGCAGRVVLYVGIALCGTAAIAFVALLYAALKFRKAKRRQARDRDGGGDGGERGADPLPPGKGDLSSSQLSLISDLHNYEDVSASDSDGPKTNHVTGDDGKKRRRRKKKASASTAANNYSHITPANGRAAATLPPGLKLCPPANGSDDNGASSGEDDYNELDLVSSPRQESAHVIRESLAAAAASGQGDVVVSRAGKGGKGEASLPEGEGEEEEDALYEAMDDVDRRGREGGSYPRDTQPGQDCPASALSPPPPGVATSASNIYSDVDSYGPPPSLPTSPPPSLWTGPRRAGSLQADRLIGEERGGRLGGRGHAYSKSLDLHASPFPDSRPGAGGSASRLYDHVLGLEALQPDDTPQPPPTSSSPQPSTSDTPPLLSQQPPPPPPPPCLARPPDTGTADPRPPDVSQPADTPQPPPLSPTSTSDTCPLLPRQQQEQQPEPAMAGTAETRGEETPPAPAPPPDLPSPEWDRVVLRRKPRRSKKASGQQAGQAASMVEWQLRELNCGLLELETAVRRSMEITRHELDLVDPVLCGTLPRDRRSLPTTEL